MALQVFGKRHAVGKLRDAAHVLVEPEIPTQGEERRGKLGGLGIDPPISRPLAL